MYDWHAGQLNHCCKPTVGRPVVAAGTAVTEADVWDNLRRVAAQAHNGAARGNVSRWLCRQLS